MRFKFLVSLAVFACMFLAGCANTVAGAGEDITNMGHAVTNSTK